MNERPILFSGPMVKAILAGRKTQTRRLVKPKPGFRAGLLPQLFVELCNPYGAPGDRLWVKETFGYHLCAGSDSERVHYRADSECCPTDGERIPRWRPSIFMPRRLSRLTLEVKRVRVERLQDISPADCKAEGLDREIHSWAVPGNNTELFREGWQAYRRLWETINGRRTWSKNPWVWVVEFGMAWDCE